MWTRGGPTPPLGFVPPSGSSANKHELGERPRLGSALDHVRRNGDDRMRVAGERQPIAAAAHQRVEVRWSRQRGRLAAKVENSSTSAADGNEVDVAVAPGNDRQLPELQVVSQLCGEDRLSLSSLLLNLCCGSRSQLLPQLPILLEFPASRLVHTPA